MGNVAFKEPSDIPDADRQSVFDGAPPSLEGIAQLIKCGRAKNVVVLVGAGASVSAGIPDFRTPHTGLYDNLQKYQLPEGKPESVFDLDYFRTTPAAFYALAAELYPSPHRSPTTAHLLLRLLHDHGVLRRVYTQNIDGLERQAGLPPQKVIACHGSFDAAHCIECDAEADATEVRNAILGGQTPRCERCGGLCKPRIIFFGEPLGATFRAAKAADLCVERDPRSAEEVAAAEAWAAELVKKDLRAGWGLLGEAELEAYRAEKARCEEARARAAAAVVVECACDLLLVLGTSLQVAPVSGLVDEVHWLTPRLLINREVVHAHGEPPPEWPPRAGGDPGFRFALDDNYRDVLCQAECDEGARRLIELLGWQRELAAHERRWRTPPQVRARASSDTATSAATRESE